MNRHLRTVVALATVQAALIGGYLLLGRGRDSPRPPVNTAAETMSSPMPSLVVRYADGSSEDLANRRERPLLLHFWATWCPPCRQELPGLIALAEKRAAHILLIALDENWEPVRRFLDAPAPPFMALADSGQVERLFGVQQLPESFVVDRAGNMTLRFRGAQDWTALATLELLPKELR